MKRTFGLTAIELAAIAIFAVFAALILLYQQRNIQASQRDENRKAAINAMHYNLEVVFYKKNGFYPSEINSENLTAMDAELFTDPEGSALENPKSDYRYTAIDCQDDRCQAYKLTAHLEKEADYNKTNRN